MKYVRTFLYKYDGDEKVKNWQWFLVLMNSYKGIKAVYIKMEKMPIFNEFQHQIHCTSEICNGIHKPTIYSITRLKENDAIPNMAYCYEEETEREFPVLYLQHGHGENEIGWTASGKVNFILDNLIAEKKAVPMVIVMSNGMVQTCLLYTSDAADEL